MRLLRDAHTTTVRDELVHGAVSSNFILKSVNKLSIVPNAISTGNVRVYTHEQDGSSFSTIYRRRIAVDDVSRDWLILGSKCKL